MKIIEHDGIQYYIGRNAKDNSELFNKMEDSDLFFHLDKCSGAHVYIKSENIEYHNDRIVITDIIKKAAELTKEYSGKKAGMYNQVCYIEKKYIKTNSNEPGVVYFTKAPYIIRI